MTNETGRKKHDNRWWEFYFVRYFVGTAIGAIVVLVLAVSKSPMSANQGGVAAILTSLKSTSFDSGHIAALTTIGLAFCYIASAPILVLHATRGSLLKRRSTFDKKIVWMFSLTVLSATAYQSHALWVALETRGHPLASQDFYAGTIFLFLVSLIFLGQLFLLRLSIFGKEECAFKYYDSLAAKRANVGGVGEEYIESYRHLREHGNAFFIVLLELLLGAALYYSPVPWAIVIMLWIFPAAGVWFFSTRLESREF